MEQHRGLNTSSVQNSSVWKKIWKVKVLPKVKNFIWRLVKDIAPTRMAINNRFDVAEQHCLLCKGAAETSIHLFKECGVTACIWLYSPFGLSVRHHNAESMLVWIEAMINTLDSEQVEVFFMMLWAIWLARNDVLWNGKSIVPQRIVEGALKLLQEYKQVQSASGKVIRSRAIAKWEAPPRGRLKLNVDGAFKDNGRGGAGMIVRDDKGSVIAAWSLTLNSLNSPLHAEVLACREGMSVALQWGWKNMLVESDNEILVNSLKSITHDHWEVGCLLEDCRDLLKGFECIEVRHIYREANNAAHRLAHFASLGSEVDLRLGEVPSILVDVIFEDYCTAVSEVQGQAIMSPLFPQSSNNTANRIGTQTH